MSYFVIHHEISISRIFIFESLSNGVRIEGFADLSNQMVSKNSIYLVHLDMIRRLETVS